MRWRLGGTLGGFALVLTAATVTPAGGTAGAQEAARTCNGRAVTISWDDPGVGLIINGTNGPDVIQGGPQSETINGKGGDDVACGGDGLDDFDGGPGRDELIGQGDSDLFRGADLFQDLITGGSGDHDEANYGSLTTGVTVDMGTGGVHATGAGVNGGILGIEVVRGTRFADTLIGGSGENRLYGKTGNDVLDGRGGEDVLDGGPGTDRVTFAASQSSVLVNLSQQLARVVGGPEDTLVDIEGATGSPKADSLVGNSEANELAGGGGDDKLKGKGGDDILEGGNGDDVLFPGGGDDYVDGGANDPVTSSGEHGDLVSYESDTLDPGRTFLDVGLYFFAPLNSPPYALGVGDDELAGIESVRGVKDRKTHVQGNDGPNVIIGGSAQDFLAGRGGNDLIYGLGSADILNGDYAAHENDAVFGNDYLDGGTPNGAGDPDSVHGNNGVDTCTGAIPVAGDNMASCETIF